MNTLKDLKLSNFNFDHNKRKCLIIPELSPYLIYKVLKDNFGSPNNDEIDELKIQWSYRFIINDSYVEIYDWKNISCSIAIYSENDNKENAEKLAKKIKTLLEKDASKFQKDYKGKLKDPEARIIQNPYSLYYTTAENLRELGKEIIEKSTKDKKVQDSFHAFQKQYDISRAAFLMYLSSFEAFLNLIYELHLKEEHREERIYGTINRHQIDVKLRMIPTYCNGFNVNSINTEDDRFKNYLNIVNLRNDFVHANFIKSEENQIIIEDGFEFIHSKYKDDDIPKNFGLISIDHVDTAKKYIDDIIDLVIESMKKNYRKNLIRILPFEEIQINKAVE